ncbi:MAG: DNA/RNA non-specific endonuclease [Phycisphaerae bacterium]
MLLLTNIAPQRHELNVGVWEALEQLEDDDYAQRFGQIWVIDGPLFDADPPRLHGEIQVPRAFYKILVREENGRPRFLAFIIPQPGPEGQRGGTDRSVARAAAPRRFLASVKQVERASQLDFFWQLERTIQDSAESSIPADIW